jgi:cell wall-associated NlpC family hydrolase
MITAAMIAMIVMVGGLAFTAPAADAAPRADRIVKIAASKKGSPYQWGATGPNRFDCSGFTQFVYRKAGKKLPRTSSQQARATKYVRKSDRRRGDLVFFHNRGSVYHVAIYAGRNMVWHSAKPGTRVHKAKIWTGSVRYGRVR